MKYKILLFLLILIITTTMVAATDNTTDTNTPVNSIQEERVNTNLHNTKIADEKSISADNNKKVIEKSYQNSTKTATATELSIDQSYGSTYYGGYLSYSAYTLEPSEEFEGYYDRNYDVDGQVDVYIDEYHLSSQGVREGFVTWEFGDDTYMDYLVGLHNITVIYTNDDTTIEKNTTLDIELAEPEINVGEDIRIENGQILLPVNVRAVYSNIKHGTITAKYNNITITSNTLSGTEAIAFEDPVYYDLIIPARYGQKTIRLEYSDNQTFVTDANIETYLDIVVQGTGGIPTNIEIKSTKLINSTHMDYDEIIYDSLNLNITVEVTGEDEILTTGQLTAYYQDDIIASTNNPTSILIPPQYNMEEITLVYTGTGLYDNSTIVFTPQADKFTTRSYISLVSGAKNQYVNLYPSITSSVPFLYGTINIYIDDNLIQQINVDNQTYISYKNNRSTVISTLNLNGYDEGVYDLTIEVEENNVFTASEYSSTLTVSRIGTYLYLNDRTIYVEDTSNLYAKVYANNRQTINDGLMSFYIDDELIGMESIDNATALLEYATPSTLAIGKHNLTVVYMGSESYDTSNKTVTLTVAKTSTTTTLRTWTIQDEQIVLNTTIRAWNKTINTGVVTAYINDTIVATANVTNNQSTLILPGTVNTDTHYKLLLVYSGDTKLNSSNYEQDDFIFSKRSTTIRFYPYLRTNGTLTATAYIYSDNYAKVDTGNIIFTINGKTIATTSVKDNKANITYDMKEYTAGNYTIIATYNGSKQYKNSTNSSIIVRIEYHAKTYMKLSNSSLRAKKGETININATLTSYSVNITEDIKGELEIITDTQTLYVENVTFKNGKLNKTLTIPVGISSLDELSTTLVITTHNSTNFLETTGSASLVIGGDYTSLYQKTLWGYKQGNITFNTTLQDKNKQKAITNTTLTVKILDTQGELVTNWTGKIVNGQYNYVYQLPNKLTENTYKVNITVNANKDYASSTRLVNMTLNNRRTYISATNTIGYIGKTVVLNGTVTDSLTRTKAVTNEEVTISIDGKTVATVNANKGVFRYTLNNNLTEGKHQVTYTYKGDTVYANSTRTLNLTSNKNTLRITVPTTSASIGDTVKITATVTNTSGALVKDNLKANILLNGKTIATSIDVTGGKLSYNYTVPTGTSYSNKITVIIQETGIYKTRNATTILTVKKAYQYVNVASTTITSTTGSKIYITGNITDKNKNLISNSKLNIKIAGKEITNITVTNGKFNYEYTVTQTKGTYSILLTALASDSYYYNSKYMSLKITG